MSALVGRAASTSLGNHCATSAAQPARSLACPSSGTMTAASATTKYGN